MARAAKKKRGPGRPKKLASERSNRVQLSLRVTPEVKALLDAASDSSGRSQSQEAEFRLERSFERQDLVLDGLELTHGKVAAGLLFLLGRALNNAVAQVRFSSDKDAVSGPDGRPLTGIANDAWLPWPYTYNEVAKAIAQVIEDLRPSGEIVALPETNSTISTFGWKDIGSHAANAVIRWLAAPSEVGDDPRTRVRTLLGPIAPPLQTVKKKSERDLG